MIIQIVHPDGKVYMNECKKVIISEDGLKLDGKSVASVKLENVFRSEDIPYCNFSSIVLLRGGE